MHYSQYARVAIGFTSGLDEKLKTARPVNLPRINPLVWVKQVTTTMNVFYLKNEYEDGEVYFKVDRITDPLDEYIYDATEIMIEGETITQDEYELTEDDLQEMYDDGFEQIPATEYEQANQRHQSLDL